ncbi:hypothetical protein [Ochrobactrum sp. AP1BH01-1]|uniref:hypothetical protein n=1 Tax=Ochrobactrum sp. AP1BH01-1 TaxID=2823874 RepID=UPI001B39CCA0|nr:hypothetical protein [Ochrobactrum sp. AP1BH01-1]MBQ0707835.1 hypothetical protein [Ochrobactrum sp. AP1BH01-1]
MIIENVIELKWLDAEHTILGGVVVTSDLGTIPVCIRDNYDTPEGRKLWDDALSGNYGPILEYSKPDPGPEPAPDEISRRQFFQYLAVIGIISKEEALAAMQGGVIPAPLQAIIDQLPTEDDKFNAQMFVVGAQNFNRLHWLTDVVRQAMNWTLEQRDDFWREAAKL